MLKHAKKRSSEQPRRDSQDERCLEQTTTENQDSKQVQPCHLNGFVGTSVQHSSTDDEKEEKEKISFRAAQEEWDSIPNFTPGCGESIPKSQLISFNEALQYFQTLDLSLHMKSIKPSLHRSFFASLIHFFCGPPRLNRELIEERNLVFAIGQCSFEDTQSVHLRVLQTIYKKLVGSKIDCARYGSHWEQIGFQGNDPSTDLRGTGFLGLMNILYLVMDTEILPLAREIYKLSQNETQNFPFCVMSINITRVAVQALREDVLNRECNQRKQVIAVMNDFYAGTILYLYQIWKKEKKTIADSGYVLKDVEAYAKRNPREIIKNLKLYLENKRNSQAMDSPNISKGPEEKIFTFSKI